MTISPIMQPQLFLAKSRGCHQECRFYSSLRFYYRISIYFERNWSRRTLFNVRNKEIKKRPCFYSLKPVFFHLQRGKLHTAATFFYTICVSRPPRTGNNDTGGQPEGHLCRLVLASYEVFSDEREEISSGVTLTCDSRQPCLTVNLDLFVPLRHPSA